MRLVIWFLCLLLAGCGKVGDPLPPFIRVPQAVSDLIVRQVGRDLILSWTTPARYIDGSAATDLARVEVRGNDLALATLAVTAPGQIQTYTFPFDSFGVQRSFTVRIETAGGRMSSVSNAVSISPVEVPGRVVRLRAVVDQRRIVLNWEPPQDHPELADAYLVTRIDPREMQTVPQTSYEDVRYAPGRAYTYEVTAMRGAVPGVGPEILNVVVQDSIPPAIPTSLDIVVSETGAFLTWAANPETDLAGYRVFRSEVADGSFTPVSGGLNATNAWFDAAYQPGRYYAVSAVDDFGNESARSAPLQAP